MIRQDQNPTGRSNSGRVPAQRNYNRSASFLGLGDLFGGGGQSTQTTTQQNLPDWAVPDAMSTLAMGNYYTQTPDYRASTLDRDYSGIRGYNAQGQPNSQVGQFGLNPMPAQRMPALPGTNFDGTPSYRPNDINNQISVPDNLILQSPLNLGRGRGRSAASEDEGNFFSDTWNSITDFFSSDSETTDESEAGSGLTTGGGSDLLVDDEDAGTLPANVQPGTGTGTGPNGSDNTGSNNQTNTQTNNQTNNQTNTNTTNTTPAQPTIDPRDIFNPDDLTPFQAYDRQRFAAPSQNTLRGEGILAGRYNQRFGLGGTDPFAAATTAVDKAANYRSGFQGTTGGIGGQAGGYQAGLASATNPGVFSGSTDYKAGLDTKFSNPNAGLQNVNAGMRNVNAGMRNVNAGLRSATYGNANQGLQAPVNYQQGKTLRDSMQQFQDPYTDQVVNQTIKDMDRARQMTANQISGDSAKAGAYGGSRSMLMQAENNRNFADRTAAAVGQLRSQGFQRAADLAQQENLQRLGLSASDVQQARGLQSQGNLQGQNLTANDLQNVRALQSQGALTAQGLQSQGALAAQGLQSQGGLAAQGLQSQGALAALNANANLYGQGLNLGAGMDQAALQANAGLLSDAMSLDAADLNQRRSLASNEAQFAENALQNAGALNLQGGQALSQLAQAGIADERQRIADMLASGQAGDARNQQDLDFIFNEFNRELAYPGQQIDLRNAAISPATGSIVTTTQPRYEQNPILGGAGAALAAYGMTSNPYIAGGAALLSLLS